MTIGRKTGGRQKGGLNKTTRDVKEMVLGALNAAGGQEYLTEQAAANPKAFMECRRLAEAMVWPNGRVCPVCGYKRSIALAGRDMGRYRARPGL